MHTLGQFIMKSRSNAILLALAFAAIPLFNWAGVVIMAMVTLRRGPSEGFLVLLAIIALDIFRALYIGLASPLLLSVLGGALYVWCMAAVLRTANSWSQVLLVTALLGSLVVLLVHGLMGDVALYWKAQLKSVLEAKLHALPAQEQEAFTQAVGQVNGLEYLSQFARVATGLVVAMTFFGSLFNLLLARWWQALLYNPGGLRGELYQIRMGYLPAGLLLLTGLLTALSFDAAWDVLPIFGLVFCLAGTSLIHSCASKISKGQGIALLVFFYIILIFISPYSLLLLMLLAFFDSFINIRNQLEAG